MLEIVIFSAILTKLNNPMTIKINMKCKCHKRKEIFKFLGRKVYRFSFDRRRKRYGKDGFDKLDKKITTRKRIFDEARQSRINQYKIYISGIKY